VPARSKIERFDQFLEEITAKPDTYSVSSTPSGTLWSNVAVYMQQKLGLKFRLANYRGGGPSVRAVLSGETDFGCMGVTPMVQFIKAGELRCIAAWTAEDWETAGVTIPSIARFVDDPLMKRTLPWTNIHGIATRKGVDEAILARIDAAFAQAVEDPKVKQIEVDNAFFPFHAGRDKANDMMGERTALQAYIIEVILGTHVKTRDELNIPKLEQS
jgi:tripartite-type tricarboxylate transporter receptor subunit TctC